jgi:hypothetical protein
VLAPVPPNAVAAGYIIPQKRAQSAKGDIPKGFIRNTNNATFILLSDASYKEIVDFYENRLPEGLDRYNMGAEKGVRALLISTLLDSPFSILIQEIEGKKAMKTILTDEAAARVHTQIKIEWK